MSIFKRMKDILFDEEETIEEIGEIKPEVKKEEVKEIKRVEPIEEVQPIVSEKETYRTDKTFPFPDFDEDEFETSVYKKNPRLNTRTDLFEYERPKPREKEVFKYERVEVKERVTREKFQPSPIISPVYGVLNRNYESDDIKNREENKTLNVESVRKKAFGEIEELEKSIDKTVSEFYKKKEVVETTIPIEEKKEKIKTIDELLENTEELPIPVREEVELPKIKEENIEDTLESDLFDLIDSMYENQEED